MSLRIALVAPFAVHPKGTTRWRVLPLARALADLGHQVRVVVPPYDWPAHSGQRWRWADATIVNARVSKVPAGVGHLVLAQRLLLGVMDWKPDVVHVFKPQGYSGLVGQWLLLARRKLPVVVDVDDWELGWNRRLGYPLPWQWFFASQERFLLGRAAAVTAASRWLEAYVGGQRSLDRTVYYLPNGATVSQPDPTWASCSEPKFADGFGPVNESPRQCQYLLLYTRYVEHGASQVWRVWHEVARSAPNTCLLVAGTRGGSQERYLTDQARRAGLASSIRFLGWLPPLSRHGLFAAVQAAMLPVEDTPLNQAKAPMRLLDLLAAGVPTAVHGVGEYDVYVEDGETGLVAPAGDNLALADAVVWLLQHPRLGCQLGRAAQQVIYHHYSWRRLVHHALGAYAAAMAA